LRVNPQPKKFNGKPGDLLKDKPNSAK